MAASESALSAQSQPSLWRPRFWPAWMIVFLLFLLSKLPMTTKQRWGKKLGLFLQKKLRSRARVADRNLQVCMPELSAEERDQLVSDNFIACTRGVFETAHAWWADMTPYEQAVEVLGYEHVQEAEKNGRGILLIGGHYSIFDFALPLIACRLSKPGYMYRPNDNPVIDRTIEKGRQCHYGIRSFHKRQIRDMMDFLRDGGAVWYGCDQDFGRKTEVFTPFFGVQAGCITTPSFIARESGCQVICVSHLRKPDGGYRVEFSPIQTGFGEDEQQDAAAWNGFIERTIRQFPDQYLWMHKRFKTRPEGADPIY